MHRTRIAAFVMALLAAACSSTPSTSQVSVMLKDAPGAFSEVWVTISEVDLMGANGKVVLTDGTPQTVDLVQLANKLAPLVTTKEVPTGTYSELRFVITGGCVLLADGKTTYATPGYVPPASSVAAGGTLAGTLKMPSYAESGLKITMPADALDITGETKILLVDFDVSQSFGHDAGNSGSWVMHPVVNGIDFTLSGGISVTATLAAGVTLTGGKLYAVRTTGSAFDVTVDSPAMIQLTPVPASSPTRYAGTFDYLFPGSYSVSLQFVPDSSSASVTLTYSPTAAPVTVVSQQDATASFTIDGFVVAE